MIDGWSPPVGGLLFLWGDFGWGLLVCEDWEWDCGFGRFLDWTWGFIFMTATKLVNSATNLVNRATNEFSPGNIKQFIL